MSPKGEAIRDLSIRVVIVAIIGRSSQAEDFKEGTPSIIPHMFLVYFSP